jgi:hypothetical protein
MDEMAKKFQESKESGKEIDASSISFTSSDTLAVYNQRMGGVFQDMYDLNYI